VIPLKDLQAKCHSHLRDAEVLLQADRAETSIYMSCFAVELALKVRICRALNWDSFPLDGNDFEGLSSLKTHKMEYLVRFTGLDPGLSRELLVPWSAVKETWDPEMRYEPEGKRTVRDAERILGHAKRVVEFLCKG
jgi:hypothetical protein